MIGRSLRVLVIDDETLARQRLISLLARTPDVEVVGECQNGLEAVAAIRAEEPDLVFLDVQMPELDGFDVITEFGAVDYLLKPVDHVRFHQTLDRAKKRLRESPQPNVSSQLSALLKYVGQLDAPKNRIGVKVNGKILFLDPDEIFWIQARDDLARIHLAEVAYDVREPLSKLEARLPHNRFLRVHRSTIVNTAQVREAQPFDQGDQLLILRNGKRITTGRSYRKAVQEFLKRAT